MCWSFFLVKSMLPFFPTELEGSKFDLPAVCRVLSLTTSQHRWMSCVPPWWPLQNLPPRSRWSRWDIWSRGIANDVGLGGWFDPRTKGHIEFSFTLPLCQKMRCQECPIFFWEKKTLSSTPEEMVKPWWSCEYQGKWSPQEGFSLVMSTSMMLILKFCEVCHDYHIS